jgi:hypothetical protein
VPTAAPHVACLRRKDSASGNLGKRLPDSPCCARTRLLV